MTSMILCELTNNQGISKNEIIGWLVLCLIAGWNIIATFEFSKKIEDVKNRLKKSEIKFSRYNQMQVDALNSIYKKIVYFHYANTTLFKSDFQLNNHAGFKNSINNWMKSYIDCVNEFSLEKILLPDTLKQLISITLENFDEVKKTIISEREELADMEMQYREELYFCLDDELEAINKKISKIKSNSSIEIAEKHIKELRKAIEKYFEELNT